MSDLQLLLGRAGVRIGSTFNDDRFKSPDDVAEAFGLRRIGDNWKEVTKQRAELILKALLEQDLAYNSEADTSKNSSEYSKEFIDWFREDSRFFTNAEWKEDDDFSTKSIRSWTPATSATFDSGVLVLGSQSGVYWLEDED